MYVLNTSAAVIATNEVAVQGFNIGLRTEKSPIRQLLE